MSFDGAQALPPRELFQPHTTCIAYILMHESFQPTARHFVGTFLLRCPEDHCLSVLVAVNSSYFAAPAIVSTDGRSIAIFVKRSEVRRKSGT